MGYVTRRTGPRIQALPPPRNNPPAAGPSQTTNDDTERPLVQMADDDDDSNWTSFASSLPENQSPQQSADQEGPYSQMSAWVAQRGYLLDTAYRPPFLGFMSSWIDPSSGRPYASLARNRCAPSEVNHNVYQCGNAANIINANWASLAPYFDQLLVLPSDVQAAHMAQYGRNVETVQGEYLVSEENLQHDLVSGAVMLIQCPTGIRLVSPSANIDAVRCGIIAEDDERNVSLYSDDNGDWIAPGFQPATSVHVSARLERGNWRIFNSYMDVQAHGYGFTVRSSYMHDDYAFSFDIRLPRAGPAHN